MDNNIYQALEKIVSDIVQSDKHEEKHLLIILELFIAHIFANKTTDLYVSIIIEEAGRHVKKILSDTDKEQWFINLNEDQKKITITGKYKRFFKKVSNAIKQLYFLLRASLKLEYGLFLQYYPYIPPNNKYFEMIRIAAGAVRREDYFLFGCISIAYQSAKYRGFLVAELIDTLTQCAAAEFSNVVVKDFQKGHPLLESVKNTLMRKNKCFKKFSEDMITTIVKMLKEYFAADNPFAQRFSAVDNSLHSNSLTTKDDALQSTSSFLLPATKVSTVTRKEQCQSDVLKVLATLENKSAQSPIPDVSSSSSSSKSMSTKSGLPSTKPNLPLAGNPILAVSQFLSTHKISKTQALQFFYNKRMQFNEGEDCIVSSKGFRSYRVDESNANENEIVAAGVLTCILHAIRLLFVGELLPASNNQYGLFQSLLNKMVTNMKLWTVDEVLAGLNFKASEMDNSNRFNSFVVQFCNEHPNLFTVLPTIAWSKFSTPETQQRTVGELYYSSSVRGQRSSIFFLAFTDEPSPKISIPYSFLCVSPSKEPNSTDKNGAIDPEAWAAGKTCLQLVGLVYGAKQYSFQFVTYSRSREDGQYQVFLLDQNGTVDLLHAVPYPETDRYGKRKYPVEALPLLASDPSGRPLVGLILMRNDNLSGDEDRHYLGEPVLQKIYENCSHHASARVGTNNYCNILSSFLKTLSSSTKWLRDEVIHGIINLMCDHLKSKHVTTAENTFYMCTSSSYNAYISGNRFSGLMVSDIRDSAFGVFIINIDNFHWICGCSSRTLKTIYFLDSMNTKAFVDEKAKEIISFFQLKVGFLGYKHVMLPSSDQFDGCNCGVFTILNATIFLKSIFEGSFDPENLQKRKQRVYSRDDKITLRATMRRVLERTEDVGCLLQWI